MKSGVPRQSDARTRRGRNGIDWAALLVRGRMGGGGDVESELSSGSDRHFRTDVMISFGDELSGAACRDCSSSKLDSCSFISWRVAFNCVDASSPLEFCDKNPLSFAKL